jgi:hypothetical protein
MCSVSSVVLDMDIVRTIVACETVDKLTLLENLYVLNEYEQGLVYERKVEIITRLLEWGMENERHGLAANLSDSWKPEQRRHFLAEWNVDEALRLVLNKEALQHSSDEPQSGRGERRSIDEVNEGTSEQVSENNYFTVMSVKQVQVKVVQSNHEFRLNDSVNVNVVHVEMPFNKQKIDCSY